MLIDCYKKKTNAAIRSLYSIYTQLIKPWNSLHHVVVVITTIKLHSINPVLKFCAGSNTAHDVLEICDSQNL